MNPSKSQFIVSESPKRQNCSISIEKKPPFATVERNMEESYSYSIITHSIKSQEYLKKTPLATISSNERNQLHQRIYGKQEVTKKYHRFKSLFSSKSLVEDARSLSLKARNDWTNSTRRGNFFQWRTKKTFVKDSPYGDFMDLDMSENKNVTNIGDDISLKILNISIDCVGRLFPVPDRQREGRKYAKKSALSYCKASMLEKDQCLPKHIAFKRIDPIPPLTFAKNQSCKPCNFEFFVPRLQIPFKSIGEIKTEENQSLDLHKHDYMEYFAQHSKEENAIHH